MHQKRPFLTRKGDDGFNPTQAQASKGNDGFKQPGHLADRAWPGDRWAADVTNVVKPTRFKSPREDLCYKRRQSKPKNHHFQRKALGLTTFVTTGQKSTRKTPPIDDVCNNTHQSTPKTQRKRRDNMTTLKPTTPLRTPNKGTLKPPSPLHPKNAPKTPISHPQRR